MESEPCPTERSSLPIIFNHYRQQLDTRIDEILALPDGKVRNELVHVWRRACSLLCKALQQIAETGAAEPHTMETLDWQMDILFQEMNLRPLTENFRGRIVDDTMQDVHSTMPSTYQ